MPFVVDMFAVEVFWRMPPSLGFEGAKARAAIELLREDSRVRDEGIIMADGLEKVRGRSESERRERRESGSERGGEERGGKVKESVSLFPLFSFRPKAPKTEEKELSNGCREDLDSRGRHRRCIHRALLLLLHRSARRPRARARRPRRRERRRKVWRPIRCRRRRRIRRFFLR